MALDLTRYCDGEPWYEAARLDSAFECLGVQNCSAVYTLLPAGEVQVVNTAHGAVFGLPYSVRGVARTTGRDNRALAVSFLDSMNSKTNYFVLDFDADAYQWAVVVGPQKGGLAWVLVRDNYEMSEELARRLVGELMLHGILVEKMVFNTADRSTRNRCLVSAERLRQAEEEIVVHRQVHT